MDTREITEYAYCKSEGCNGLVTVAPWIWCVVCKQNRVERTGSVDDAE